MLLFPALATDQEFVNVLDRRSSALLNTGFPHVLCLCIGFQICVLGGTVHMSRPHSLWSLHHLFSDFQYIFSFPFTSCKELKAELIAQQDWMLQLSDFQLIKSI